MTGTPIAVNVIGFKYELNKIIASFGEGSIWHPNVRCRLVANKSQQLAHNSPGP